MIRGAKDEIGELWDNRERIWNLTKNELKMEFGQSRLGLLWSLLEPAGIILVYAIIFPMIIGVDFYSWVLFFVAGFIPHRFLEDGITSATGSLVDNRSILNQISLKEEIVPIASCLASSIKFLLECIVFFSIIFISGVLPDHFILIFPVIFFAEFLIVLGFGMHLSVSYVETRDINHILNVFFQALFFLTPIVYRLSKITEAYRGVYLLNPISRLILLYQKSLLHSLEGFVSYIPTVENLLLLLFFSVVVFIIGYTSFSRRKKKYVGEI
ncbi:MAG: ABC transporter permease [Candidatus Aenigmatarchaeota archaeon]